MTAAPIDQPPPDFRHDPTFAWPERVPWSELAPYFAMAWGRAEPSNPQPEDVEAVGQKGSGKTRLIMHMLQDRYSYRQGGAVFIATKTDDELFKRLGWPIVTRAQEVAGNPNVIFWPRTRLMGNARKAYHERELSSLLHRLWRPKANTVVCFDEIAYAESLSGDLRALIQQYWREARSLGITVMAMKQRPQGTQRDMHSETQWTIGFKPKDRADLERWAELFGARRDWMPVFDTLDAARHEFIIRHSRTGDAYISWVDVPLYPQNVKQGRGHEARIRGNGA